MYSRIIGDTALEKILKEIRKEKGFDKEQHRKNFLNQFTNAELEKFMRERGYHEIQRQVRAC